EVRDGALEFLAVRRVEGRAVHLEQLLDVARLGRPRPREIEALHQLVDDGAAQQLVELLGNRLAGGVRQVRTALVEPGHALEIEAVRAAAGTLPAPVRDAP